LLDTPAISLSRLYPPRARPAICSSSGSSTESHEDPAQLADQFPQALLQAAQNLCHGKRDVHRPSCDRLYWLAGFSVLIRSLQNDSPFFLSEKLPRAYHRLWGESFLLYELSDILELHPVFDTAKQRESIGAAISFLSEQR
jgi:hypothetical protein